jgi:hypothetical protein
MKKKQEQYGFDFEEERPILMIQGKKESGASQNLSEDNNL